MSRILKNYQRKRKGGRPFNYPWDKWFDGNTYELTRGKDFKCTLKAMRVHIYRMAKRHNLKMGVDIEGATLIISPITATPLLKGIIKLPTKTKQPDPVSQTKRTNPYANAEPPVKVAKRRKPTHAHRDVHDRAKVQPLDEDGHTKPLPKSRTPKLEAAPPKPGKVATSLLTGAANNRPAFLK